MITVYLRWGWEEVVVGLAWLSVFSCPGSRCSDGWINPVVVTIRCQEGPKGEGRHAVDLRVIKGDFLRHSKGLSPLASHTGTRNVKTSTGCVTDWQSPSKDWIKRISGGKTFFKISLTRDSYTYWVRQGLNNGEGEVFTLIWTTASASLHLY